MLNRPAESATGLRAAGFVVLAMLIRTYRTEEQTWQARSPLEK
jgi:hypothetical protein